MSAAGPAPPLIAYLEALVGAAERIPSLSAVSVASAADAGPSLFARRFPARHVALGPEEAEVVGVTVERSADGGPVFVAAPVPFLVETAYLSLVRSLVLPRRNVKLVGVPLEVGREADRLGPPARDDLAAMRALPSMTIVAPADAPTVRGATVALADHDGPAYLSLPAAGAPPVTDGTFALGRAHELRAGSDLTVVALGAMLSPALEVAGELGQVGISVRVLDVASVCPFDEAALLRAARDTGAVLVAEAAPLATGVGTLVAAMTAENYPVPVRRVGLTAGRRAAGDTSSELSLERLREEAWELLRLRGKAT